jgi:hypothetical protein
MRSAKLRTNSTKVYWTRRARGGSKKASTVSKRDYNFDGVIDDKDSIFEKSLWKWKLAGIIIGIVICGLALVFGDSTPRPTWKYLI